MAREYLVQATNEIFLVHSRKGRSSPENARLALSLACESMTLLRDDGEFLNAVAARSAGTSPEEAHEIRRTLENVDEFCRVFLRTEAEALRDAGLHPLAVKGLIAQAERLRSRVRIDVSAETFRYELQEFQHAACRESTRAQTVADAELQDQEFMGRVRSVAEGTGGAAFVVANLGLFGITFGMSAAESKLSMSIGGTLIKDATATLKKWWKG